MKCPVCGSEKFLHEVNQDVKFSEVVLLERKTIQQKMFELKKTISLIQGDLNANEEQQMFYTDRIQKLDEEITRCHLIDVSDKLNHLQNLILLQDKSNQEKYIKTKIETNSYSRDQFVRRLTQQNEKISANNNEKLSDEIMSSICGYVSDLLVEWRLLRKADVKFDKDDSYDVVINGKPKEGFGKSYTAIINTAISLSIMLHCKGKGLSYPKIIVLDSPLVTFKEKVNSEGDFGKKAPDDVKKRFYEYLTKIVEDEQLINLLTTHHFTKLIGSGRYGFFPINGENENEHDVGMETEYFRKHSIF